ncbi:MAG: UDP-glucose 4-epimerase GalE [Erysipelotrichaceae bacterium]
MKILVTGGTGYIGSHTCVTLLEAGYEVVVVDNFYNSKPDVLDKIHAITNKHVAFYELDLCDKAKLETVFQEHTIDAVIHFAGYKAVGESVAKPLMYYHNNLVSTIALCELMQAYNVSNLVFSSSATVYGNPHTVPITEDFPLSTTNPYGTTKLMIEQILTDVCHANPDFSVALLRYFNPIGAHSSALIGENPNDIPNNLMPFIVKVATQELKQLSVFGNDYDTVDGTGVRDYIHVVDLAVGHVKAVENVIKRKGVDAFNLGTGNGYSVLQVVETFEQVNNVKVPYAIVDRRPGDIATCYADTEKAWKELGWKAEKDLVTMCKDAYSFVKNFK